MKLENANSLCQDLIFQEDEHKYYLNEQEIPSVTTILRLITDFEKINKEDLDFACWRGSQVHRISELIDKNLIDLKRVEELNSLALEQMGKDPKLMEYVNAYNSIRGQFKIISSEGRLYSKKYLYAGTFDRMLTYKGKTYVADIKTGVISHSWGCQLEAYRIMIQEWIKIKDLHLMIIQLKNDGTYQLHLSTDRGNSIFNQDIVSDKAMFLSLLNISKSKKIEDIKRKLYHNF